MQKLRDLKTLYGDLPPQGSKFWLENRKHTFGGSEVATILGINPYSSLNKLVKQKVKAEYKDCLPFCWGRTFEKAALVILDLTMPTVHHFGAIPHEDGLICYSPDGVLVLQEQLVLIEIKSPIWRKVKNNIPEYYLPQVLSGIDTLDCDYGLYIENQFRKCSLEHFNFGPRFNCRFHRTVQGTEMPAYIGWFVWRGEGELVDLGKANITQTKMMLDLGEPDIRVWDEVNWPEFIIPSYWEGVRAIMCWKMVKSITRRVYPEPHYLHNKLDTFIQARELLEEEWLLKKCNTKPTDSVSSTECNEIRDSLLALEI